MSCLSTHALLELRRKICSVLHERAEEWMVHFAAAMKPLVSSCERIIWTKYQRWPYSWDGVGRQFVHEVLQELLLVVLQNHISADPPFDTVPPCLLKRRFQVSSFVQHHVRAFRIGVFQRSDPRLTPQEVAVFTVVGIISVIAALFRINSVGPGGAENTRCNRHT